MTTAKFWYARDDQPWIPSGDIPGDTLQAFRTNENELSVWFIQNDKSNLDRVVAAFATTKTSLDTLDYVLLPDNFLPPDIQVKEDAGESCDQLANEKWHRDLVQLTGHRIVELAKQFYHEGYEKEGLGRYEDSDIAILIKQGIQRSEIDVNKLNAKLRKALALVP